jgi:quinol monooxygenase YgiN
MVNPCVVIALFTPAEGQYEKVREVLLAITPEVHAEEGCELYALHEEVGGRLVFLEKWTTRELWQEHLARPSVSELSAQLAGLLAIPVDIWEMYGVAAGSTTLGEL